MDVEAVARAVLLVLGAAGLLAFPLLWGYRTRRWAMAALGVAFWVLLAILQLATRVDNLELFAEGSGLLLGAACVITRGHPERFVDDDAFEETARASRAVQIKVLAAWLPIFLSMVLVHRAEFF